MTLAKSFCPYHSWMKWKISFSTDAQRSEGNKKPMLKCAMFRSMFDVTQC